MGKEFRKIASIFGSVEHGLMERQQREPAPPDELRIGGQPPFLFLDAPDLGSKKPLIRRIILALALWRGGEPTRSDPSRSIRAARGSPW